MNEYSPAVRPDGDALRVRVESHRADDAVHGADRRRPVVLLAEVPIGAASRSSRRAAFAARARPGWHGRLPARIYLRASRRPRVHARRWVPPRDRGDRDALLPHDREVRARSARGPLTLEALKGFEYRPAAATVDVPAGGVADVTLRLNVLIDAPARGWYSGDTHVHDLHQGQIRADAQQCSISSLAEDLHVTNTLIHMDGTRLMGRWEDLTGKPHPLSTPRHILQYSEEFRGGARSHRACIGISRYILPFTAGIREHGRTRSPSWTRVPRRRARAGRHRRFHAPVQRAHRAARPTRPESLIPIDIALGKGDFYDVGALWSDERRSAEMYYRFLNCGFRIPATSGTDNFSDVWRDPPPGADRAYVQVQGPLTCAPGWRASRRSDVRHDRAAAVPRGGRQAVRATRLRCRQPRDPTSRQSRGRVDRAAGQPGDHRQWTRRRRP